MIENGQELNIEQDFWSDFIQEAFEHIEEIETNVLSLEQNPEDMEIIHTMFRAFHTIKGLSGFVEHTIIQEVAHGTETLMDYCRKGELKVNSRIVDAILKSSDFIKRLCEDVESYRDESFIAQINKLLEVLEELANVGDTPPVVKEVPVEVIAEKVEIIDEIQVASNEEENLSTAQPFNSSTEEGLDAFAASFSLEDIIIEEEPAEEPIEEMVAEVVEEVAQEAEIVDDEIAKFMSAFAQKSSEPVAETNVEPVVEVKVESIVEEVIEPVADFVAEPEVEVTEELNIEEAIEEIEMKSEEVFAEAKVDEPTEATPEIIVEEKAFEPTVEQRIEPKVEPKMPSQEFRPEPAVALKPAAVAIEEVPTVKKIFAPNEEYMKVANNKIDHLVEMIGELIINQSLIDQYISSNYSQDNQLITNMSGFLRITRELQSLSMSLRMVSLKPTFQKISRIARDTIQELSKEVEFVTSGESTEIDRVVTDKLLDPLVHLIKNAISHGVEECPEDRVANGKGRRARVELNAYNKRGKIFIEVKDDGRGIDTEIVYQKALEKGLIDPNKVYSQEEIKEFILLPGFSTAKVIDNISGRGVGMDVVKTQILKIGGKVDIQSELKKGSTFTLEVPVNHAIMNGAVIDIRGQHFIIPTINVKEILQPTDKQWIFTQQKRTMLRVREDIIPLVPISLFFKGAKLEEHVPLVMLLELDGELKALPITNVINRQEVVVKPVGEEFSHLQYISGMSILGTGKVSLILDIDYLFKKEVKA